LLENEFEKINKEKEEFKKMNFCWKKHRDIRLNFQTRLNRTRARTARKRSGIKETWTSILRGPTLAPIPETT